jgi:valyl-tRNA synthetase
MCAIARTWVGTNEEFGAWPRSRPTRYTSKALAHALQETEQFFWQRFTDTYLELAKARAREEWKDEVERVSAVVTLRLALDVLLRLFAPALPYITEEVWSWVFAEERGLPSIHRAPWPTEAELSVVAPPAETESLSIAIDALATINKAKTDRDAGVGRVVEDLELRVPAALGGRLAPVVLADILASARVRAHRTVAIEGAAFEVGAITIAPKESAKG